MSEALAPCARLPDALVGLVPVLTQPVGHGCDRRPYAIGELLGVAIERVRRVDDLAVDVELELVCGSVAHADRRRGRVAREMVEGLLGNMRSAVDPVEHLKRAVPLARRRLQTAREEVRERSQLIREAE